MWESQGAGNRRLGVGRICFCWVVTGVRQIALELWRWYSQKPALRSNEITAGGSFVHSPSQRPGEMPSPDISIAANNTPPM